jgi:hypothetical protein
MNWVNADLCGRDVRKIFAPKTVEHKLPRGRPPKYAGYDFDDCTQARDDANLPADVQTSWGHIGNARGKYMRKRPTTLESSPSGRPKPGSAAKAALSAPIAQRSWWKSGWPSTRQRNARGLSARVDGLAPCRFLGF